MSQTKIHKTLDCLPLKQQAQERIYQETKDMTPEEQVAYCKQTARLGSLGKWWQTLTKAQEQRRQNQ